MTRDVSANDPWMSAGYPSQQLPLWADFSFLILTSWATNDCVVKKNSLGFQCAISSPKHFRRKGRIVRGNTSNQCNLCTATLPELLQKSRRRRPQKRRRQLVPVSTMWRRYRNSVWLLLRREFCSASLIGGLQAATVFAATVSGSQRITLMQVHLFSPGREISL